MDNHHVRQIGWVFRKVGCNLSPTEMGKKEVVLLFVSLSDLMSWVTSNHHFNANCPECAYVEVEVICNSSRGRSKRGRSSKVVNEITSWLPHHK